MVAVIIPAGGIGERLGAKVPKQFLELAGRPLILHTLAPFLSHPEIDLIVIPCVEGWRDRLLALTRGLSKPVKVVPGGATRQASVANGLKVLPVEVELVLVHDAARPFITPEAIGAVLAKVREEGAALMALPSRDTVKRVREGRVLETLPREEIYLAQTPQGALKGLLLEAFLWAEKRGLSATDEASLLEAYGVPVHVVPGSPLNFKITTPEDLILAEAILKSSGQEHKEVFRVF